MSTELKFDRSQVLQHQDEMDRAKRACAVMLIMISGMLDQLRGLPDQNVLPAKTRQQALNGLDLAYEYVDLLRQAYLLSGIDDTVLISHNLIGHFDTNPDWLALSAQLDQELHL
jgi:hypothetical protein